MSNQPQSSPTIEFKPLSSDHWGGAFSCGVPEIDKWFRNNSGSMHKKFRSRVVTAHHIGNPAPVGFHALSLQLQDEKLLSGGERQLFRAQQRVFTSINIDYLAVARVLQGNGVGRLLLGHAIEIFYNAVVSFGVPVMTVVAVDERTCEFYSKLGFRRYGPTATQPRMLLPAQSVVDLFEQNKMLDITE